ncbi:hypothetical protein NA56DRAFT_754928 [Hyaloscypha hepaticicola]|uniref:Uncharacterized protein n=1 Tax=Hyaloscypha hepaticicola TaxID=2082293 RepID=A0A2J6PK85_9HELO|nr:hypothetical protein NA56DRAFT_754928 [Hyaloscypha hepaticicola]
MGVEATGRGGIFRGYSRPQREKTTGQDAKPGASVCLGGREAHVGLHVWPFTRHLSLGPVGPAHDGEPNALSYPMGIVVEDIPKPAQDRLIYHIDCLASHDAAINSSEKGLDTTLLDLGSQYGSDPGIPRLLRGQAEYRLSVDETLSPGSLSLSYEYLGYQSFIELSSSANPSSHHSRTS